MEPLDLLSLPVSQFFQMLMQYVFKRYRVDERDIGLTKDLTRDVGTAKAQRAHDLREGDS